MNIKIYYPSGNILNVEGDWLGPGNVEGTPVVAIIVRGKTSIPGNKQLEKDSVLVVDPRGVCRDMDSEQVIYNPRDCLVGMDQWAVDWLLKNPQWPAVLEL